MMKNNAMCRVVGIGNVKLKIHDGFIIKLKQVRHFVDLKKNLILLGMMDQIGCIVKFQNSVLNMMKGPLVLFIAIRKNEEQTLYLTRYHCYRKVICVI